MSKAHRMVFAVAASDKAALMERAGAIGVSASHLVRRAIRGLGARRGLELTPGDIDRSDTLTLRYGTEEREALAAAAARLGLPAATIVRLLVREVARSTPD